VCKTRVIYGEKKNLGNYQTEFQQVETEIESKSEEDINKEMERIKAIVKRSLKSDKRINPSGG